MNCPNRINGPLNAAGAFRCCKQEKSGGLKKTAYNNYRVDIAELLGFITDVAQQKDRWCFFGFFGFFCETLVS